MQPPLISTGSRTGWRQFLPVAAALVFAISLVANLVLWQRWRFAADETSYQRSQVSSLRAQLAGKGSAAAATEPSISPADLPPVTAADWQRGAAAPKVTLIEYSDMECPFCKRFHPTLQQVQAEYSNDVAVVYRHYPLSFHKNAQKEAEASECVGALGGQAAFWKFTDAVYDRTKAGGTGFALADLAPLAQEVGVSGASFQACLDAGTYAQKISDQTAAGAKAGVSGTPGTFAINRKGTVRFINGAQGLPAVKSVIDALINE